MKGLREGMVSGLQDHEEPLDQLIDLKMNGWLSGYHLGRENRIAMAFGMEARYPFLDEDVVEAVLPLGVQAKVGLLPPQEKRLLRRVAERYLPPRFARRPKGPVRVPVTLFGSRFYDLARDLLSPDSVSRRQLFRPDVVESLLRSAELGGFWANRKVFALVMLECWYREMA